MQIRYLGPHDEVQFPDVDPPFGCVRGETVDVPDDLAVELVAREGGTQWEIVIPPKTKPPVAADKES
jgi:hypothetical protein